jgi:hypothetical protein
MEMLAQQQADNRRLPVAAADRVVMEAVAATQAAVADSLATVLLEGLDLVDLDM